MHGGRIEASSEGSGTGSEFSVWLPLVEREADASDLVGGVSRRDRNEAATRRVLIVDDNIDAATSMMMFVRMWGYDARAAHDGVSAVETARMYRPDVVLLDLGLPILDGYEVAARLHANPMLADVSLIAVSGYGQESDRRLTTEAGFAYHFVKPVDPQKLRQVLSAVLDERRRSRDQP